MPSTVCVENEKVVCYVAEADISSVRTVLTVKYANCEAVIAQKRMNVTHVSMRDSAKLSAFTVAGCGMIETIKASGAENGFFKKWSGYQASVNTQQVKFQKMDQYLGMIPQFVSTLANNAVLFLGDIYSNIVITAPKLTVDEALEAAEIASIADDIRAMPMGMNTITSEGQGRISGGQRQRMMIARAIAQKIPMLDEATGALDNITQKKSRRPLIRSNARESLLPTGFPRSRTPTVSSISTAARSLKTVHTRS